MIKKILKEIGSFFSSLDAITKTLVTINTLIYFYSLMENKMNAIKGLTIERILNTGGMSGGTSLTTIVTSMFVHYSLTHFLLNMMILMHLSHVVSDTRSPMPYLALLILPGILGNPLGYIIEPNVVSLGASGAIFGLVGLLLIGSLQSTRYPSLHNLLGWISGTSVVLIILTF